MIIDQNLTSLAALFIIKKLL